MIHTVMGNGERGFSGDGGSATNAQLYLPCGIAISPNGEVYIADQGNHRIRKIALNGLISTVAGNGKQGFSGDGGVATNAQLNWPSGIALSSNGELYIADTFNDRIRKIAENGSISTIAGNGSKGFSGDGGEATNAQLSHPHAIAVGSGGELYIADRDNHRIRKIEPNGLISTIAGNGEKELSGDGRDAIHAQLDNPSGVAVSKNGALCIVDRHNSRIRKVSPNGLIWTIAGNGSKGLSGDGGLATNAQLSYPHGIAVGPGGDVYITDVGNHTIRKISPNGFISTIAGNGQAGLSGDGGEATKAQLNHPKCIAISLSGELYIADTQNHTIRKIDAPVMRTSLKKYERDRHTSNDLVCFRPLLAKSAPSFHEAIFKAGIFLTLNANEKQMVQRLIDSFMYGTELDLDNLEGGDGVDWLFALGMIRGSEFFEVKTRLLSNFMGALTEDSIPVVLERLDYLKERNMTENLLLSQMLDYTLGRVALILRSSPTLSANPIILRHSAQIFPKMYRTEVAPITLTETIREETQGIQSLFNDSSVSDIKILLGETKGEGIGSIQSLFNDPTMSDITILLGEKQFYCHRTILSSYSPYFEALFGNGGSFNDLKDGTYPADCTLFGEGLHEMVIKYCYNLLDEPIASMAIPLFECASFYGLSQLADYCAADIDINVENYFELVEQLGNYTCQALRVRFVEFFRSEIRSLGMIREKVGSLPEQIKEQLLWEFIEDKNKM